MSEVPLHCEQCARATVLTSVVFLITRLQAGLKKEGTEVFDESRGGAMAASTRQGLFQGGLRKAPYAPDLSKARQATQ